MTNVTSKTDEVQGYSRVLQQGFVRMSRDSARHFHIRLPAWALSVMTLTIGLDIISHPGIYSHSPALSALSPFLAERTLGYAMLVVGVLRLIALFVNGTFPPIKWTPHVRLTLSTLSCFFWGNFTLGAFFSTMPTGMVAIYPILLLIDLWNVRLAASDVVG
jgi:hypothetical protein